MRKHKYTLAVIISGVLWGIISLFIKTLSKEGLDPMQIVFIRMLIATPTFLIYALIRRRSLKIKLKDIWIFAAIGIISEFVFNCFYFYTMINSEASVAVVLLYTSPAFIMILSAVFFKEKLTAKKIAALFLTLAGCVFVSGFIGSAHQLTSTIIISGICSGLFYALYTIFGRIALKKYNTETTMVYSFAIALLFSAFTGKPVETAETVFAKPELILICLGIGIICTALPCFMYTWGLRKIDTGKAGVLVAVEPLVGAIIGMTVFAESTDVFKLIGILLIVAAIVIIDIHKPKRLLKKD